MKTLITRCFLIGIFFFAQSLQELYGQPIVELTLMEAYTLFEDRYPSLRDGALLQDIYGLESERLDKNELPTIQWKSEARLQSESASLDPGEGVMLPFEIDLPLYSVRTYLEAQYLIIDGNITNVQKTIKEIELQAKLQKIEVDRFALRDRINVLATGIVVLREQAELFDISLDNLDSRRQKVEAAVEYGTALESELKRIDVRKIELEAQRENILYRIKGLVATLSDLIGKDLSDEVRLIFPEMGNPLLIPGIDRPEMEFFSLQKNAIMARSELIDVQLAPKLSAFAQAGVGYPNPVNFLQDEIAPYGIAGLQFQWQITDWNKSKLDKEILQLEAAKVQNVENTFDFNLRSREAQYRSDIERISNLIAREHQIAGLQKEILDQLAVQLDEGVITSAEYIDQVNEELRARQQLIVHQVELLNTQLKFWSERGAF
jgi:hypothetical protein